MATIYLAHDLKHDRDCALEVLHQDLAESLGRERFLREIHLAALTHRHILPLFNWGEAGGRLYYVMPSLEGSSLRDRLDATNHLPVEDAVRITSEVANALDYAHRHSAERGVLAELVDRASKSFVEHTMLGAGAPA